MSEDYFLCCLIALFCHNSHKLTKKTYQPEDLFSLFLAPVFTQYTRQQLCVVCPKIKTYRPCDRSCDAMLFQLRFMNVETVLNDRVVLARLFPLETVYNYLYTLLLVALWPECDLLAGKICHFVVLNMRFRPMVQVELVRPRTKKWASMDHS